MITTVTTVTTVTAMAALGITAIISTVAVITLIALLVTQELASTGGSRFSMRVAKFAVVGIAPLVIVLAVVVAMQIAKII